MCTIGAIRFPDGSYALFKNKDFGRARFDDIVSLDPGVFGVAGLATWAGGDSSLDEFSGFSIGANAHGLLCCDANVRTLPGHSNYDDLVETALRHGHDVATAIVAIEEAMTDRLFHWANVVLIDGEHTGVVEVRGDRIDVLVTREPIARTNHHVTLGATRGDDNTTTSRPRLEAATRAAHAADSMGDIENLLRSHDGGNAAICVHGVHQTVYSYVLHHAAGRTALSAVQGPPCRSRHPESMTVPIGDMWSPAEADRFRSVYPSSRMSGER